MHVCSLCVYAVRVHVCVYVRAVCMCNMHVLCVCIYVGCVYMFACMSLCVCVCLTILDCLEILTHMQQN